jgi:uncharacterized protein YxeA
MKKIIVTITFLLLFATMAQAATLTTEIARVREYLYDNDSANALYTDTQITEAINQGQEMLSNLLSYSSNHENVMFGYSFSLNTGETLLSLSSSTIAVGFKKIISFGVVWPGTSSANAQMAIQVRPEDFPTRYYKGTTKDPTFILTANYIYFYPANPGGLTGFYYLYLKRYTKLTGGGDTVTVQDRYLNLLTLSAAMLVLEWDNQTTRAAALKQSLTDQITVENNQMNNSNVIEKTLTGVK